MAVWPGVRPAPGYGAVRFRTLAFGRARFGLAGLRLYLRVAREMRGSYA